MDKKTTNNPLFTSDDFSVAKGHYSLVLYNDEVNMFDYVVKSLVEVCKHTWEQAEQCTIIAHHKGKCDIKSGDKTYLKNLKDELTHRGLSSIITTKP